ncbi:hypothetical protein Verru16b_01930 [Lacunisphaera limnophila]|uniref:Uncharacterized protein n=1 Tax=Lacunisphaera limnophila TaxID=1838286 RepID=A0A1D8AVF9_9BACT|nr:hypothetical protein [Lacunisphaera limnophila]AOS44861.1 hypothetical protein Verru16b_01930 [Lacunisphaera limnophila]
MRTPACWKPLTLLLASWLVLAPAHAADESGVLTSVYGKTDSGYKRKKGPDGKWVREYYALTNGGPAEGTIQDNAQEKVRFVALATVLAEHLARQGYFPATDKDKVDLLVVVNWGRTTPLTDGAARSGTDNVLAAMNNLSNLGPAVPPTIVSPTDAASAPEAEVNLTGSAEDMQRQAAQSQLESALMTQGMFNRSRDQANDKNAFLLGYAGDLNKTDGIQRMIGGGGKFDELMADIEEPRYYVILTAYDFKRTVREKKPKVQWVTRMSMRAPGNSFAEQAAAMVAYASSRFGQNTDGLDRRVTPEYKVNLEDIRFLGVADPAAAKSAGPAEKK